MFASWIVVESFYKKGLYEMFSFSRVVFSKWVVISM